MYGCMYGCMYICMSERKKNIEIIKKNNIIFTHPHVQACTFFILSSLRHTYIHTTIHTTIHTYSL